MSRYIVFFIFIFSFQTTAFGQSHGLLFASHEVVPEKRTSLNLTPQEPFCFEGSTELSFDVNLRPNLETYFGYVLRMITPDNQNIDIVYNQKLLQFNFVIGETFSFPFSIDSIPLYHSWQHFAITVDEKDKSLSFSLNGKLLCKKENAFKTKLCSRIFFGWNDYVGLQTRDLPPMRIKDIRIVRKGDLLAFFPLSESSGTEAEDIITKKKVAVVNPHWIKPLHQKWEEVLSIVTGSTPSFTFNNHDETLYIVGLDSLYSLSLKNRLLKATALTASHSLLPPGNQAIYNPINGKLYNFYPDEKIVSEYDSINHRWDKNFSLKSLTVFWQANKFISPVDSCLYIVAGYGQLQYKNLIQRYHFANNKWDTVNTSGDFFMPRYLAALGTNQSGDTAYIIGGYGSNTGDQTINPKHVYDIMAYSVRDKRFTLIGHLKEPQQQFCFGNSVIFEPGTSNYYALTYPNNRFLSGLQLIKGSLLNNHYELMADSIPYSFYDVETFADLFYDSIGKKLVAVTLNMQKNNTSLVKAYTLDFPPNAVENITAGGTPLPWKWILMTAVAALTITAGAVVYGKRKAKVATPAKAANENNPIQTSVTPAPSPIIVASEEQVAQVQPAYKEYASVFLFGQLEVFDKEGHDITSLFTPLLKEIFLLVLIHTYKDGKGITSEKLFETIWSDKSTKDARNNYSVNSVKLKPILERIGDCHIERLSGKLKLEIQNQSVKIDYQQFRELVTTPGGATIDRANVIALLPILQRGSFASHLHYDWLDDIKSEVSGLIIDTLLQFLATTDPDTDADLIVKISNVIFISDNLNEEALSFKCKSLIFLGRHGLAKDAYNKFIKEYRENYAQDFDKTFAQVTGNV